MVASSYKRPFTMMIKPVGSRCNMQCDYCYYLDKGKYSAHAIQSCMSTEMLESLIRQIIESSVYPSVAFNWHGGEPTLAGLDFFRQAVALEKKYLPRGWRVWNNLQTNGLALSQEWCHFLKANHFDVGISIDGDELTHDSHRHDRSGKGTWKRVGLSIQRLKQAGIQPDLLCTVNRESLKAPLRIYRSLREWNTGWIQFIPILVKEGDHYSPLSISSEGYGRFLCDIFDEWITHDLGKTEIQLFAETMRVFTGGTASVCWMQPRCGQVLIAEEDGSVYSCDHFVDPAHRLGNFMETPLADLAGSAFQLSFGNQKETALAEECRKCRWLKCCHGGCLKDRLDGRYALCGGMKMFFEHAYPICQRTLLLFKEKLSPEVIMKQLQNELYYND